MAFQSMDTTVLRKLQSKGGVAAARKRQPKRARKASVAGETKIRGKRVTRNDRIRADYEKMSASKLAEKYGLSEMWVREIVSGRAERSEKRNQRRRLAKAIERVKAAGYRVEALDRNDSQGAAASQESAA